MKKRIENKISMFKAVKTHCQLNLVPISANAGLNSTYTTFVTMLDELLPIEKEQILNRKGVTMNKKDARMALVLKVEEASGILMSHFDSVHDHAIYESVDIAFSKLKSMRDMKFLAHADTVANLLTLHQAVLVPYGVDAAYLAGFQTVLQAYNDIVATPTHASNLRKTATSDLDILVAELNTFLLDRLDKAMLLLKVSHPAVYKTYRNSRRTVDNGIRHQKPNTGILKGVVKDDENGHVIENAFIEIINTETVVISDALGAFTIVGIPPDTYVIKVSAGGYETKMVEDVMIKVNETTDVEVKLIASE